MKRSITKKTALLLCIAAFMLPSLCGCDKVLQKAIDLIPETTRNTEYDNLSDQWTKEFVTEKYAIDDAFERLLKAAEDGDKEAFIKCFTPERQKELVFSRLVDSFFDNYPKGLGKEKMDIRPGGAGGSIKGDKIIKKAGGRAEVWCDGKYYRIDAGVCFVYSDEPGKVGVESFSIRNMEALAVYIDYTNKFDEYDPEKMEDPLICDIKSPDEVCAKMINGCPYLWEDTDTPKLTVEEMRQLLTEYRDLSSPEVRNKIGLPNARLKQSNSTGYDCFYELQPVNGEAHYAHITTKTELGDIIDAYDCTADGYDLDNPLCPWIKPDPDN